MVNGDVQQRLWAAADQLWANTGLRPSQFSVPVLGLIFLRYAEKTYAEAAEKLGPVGSGGRRKVSKNDYIAEGVIFLPEKARFSYLQALPEDANLGKALNDAMKAIEEENANLRGALPKSYTEIEDRVLVELLRVLAPVDLTGDAFGKVYEYFLGKFAMKEGQKGGVFYTPESIVKLIVEIVEPFAGLIYDPASGSGGMFVHSAKFVEQHRQDPTRKISLFGLEKDEVTVNLNKMNLAVHGLSGEVRVANSYYDDPFDQTGKFDFVMANPPFNVSGVDKERIGGGSRFPFGMPRGDNANYNWIQLFYSALNDQGRAGFVMHNSATDAEHEIRRQLIEDRCVDVIVLTAANLFYTVNLPCTLWFLDKAKRGSAREDQILFVDARSIYTQVTTAIREFTPEQIKTIARKVREYRGEDGEDEYTDVIGLCRRVPLEEVRDKGYSLNPKLYVEHDLSSGVDVDSSFGDYTAEWLQDARDLWNTVCESVGASVPADRGVLMWLLKLTYARTIGTPDIKSVTVRDSLERYIGGTWGKDTPDTQHTERVRIIRGTDIERVANGEIGTCPIRYIKPSQLRSRKLRALDIIIEVSGGGKEQTTGRNVMLSEELIRSSDLPLVCASFCKLFRPDTSAVPASLLYFFLQQLYDLGAMANYEVQSTGIKNFKTEYFLDNVSLPVPTEEESSTFDDFALRVLRLVHLLGRVAEATNGFVVNLGGSSVPDGMGLLQLSAMDQSASSGN